ncbi:centromere protein H [Corythoichthys intestinalis]|uniref:centromere protein H n=1 Tax=Corythoichthys intestinalis TaxID=161448 RepID=UPI0025A63A87|nr:centromere protein H [Corythoichthys intestinalis]XP_061803785.1 centromere protein H-like [Nerophis lumbriciformis]
MEPSDVRGNSDLEEDMPLNDQSDTPPDILKITAQLYAQCFEMEVQLNREKNPIPCSTAEAKQELKANVYELERIKSHHFTSTLALHRMQMWHAIARKLEQNDPEANDLKAIIDRCMTLSSHINTLQEKTMTLENGITKLQKKRLELKQRIQEKMKQIEEVKAHWYAEKYQAVLQKGSTNLENYKKMVVMAQNILRGLVLACNINWMDDPHLRDIVMKLEEFPIPD